MPLDWLNYGFESFVDAQARRFRERLAVAPDRRCRDEAARGPLSYERLRAETLMRKAAFLGSGLQRGDVVAIWGDNSVAWLTTWFGAQAAGLIVVPLNSRLTIAEVAVLCRESGARLLLADDPLVQDGPGPIGAMIADAGSALGDVDVRWLRPAAPVPVLEATPVRPVRADAQRPALAAETAMIQFTSGSTGTPKGVMLRESPLLADGACNGRRWMLDSRDSVLGVLPLYHNSGAVFTAIAALSSGSSLQLVGGWAGGSGLSGVHDPNAITVVPGIDAVLDDLAAKPGQPLPNLRLIVTGATPAYCRRIADRFGVEVANTYGLTECSPTVATGDLRDQQDLRIEYIARPHIGLKVRIASIADGETPMPAGDEGEIQISGWATMIGYIRPEHDAKAWSRDGWLRSGDLGRASPTGYIQFTGRLKELIRTGGENVSPREVEETIQRHPGVDRVAVFALPHAHFGEIVAAAVSSRDSALDAKALLDHCRSQLARFKVPRLMMRIERLPETPSKKIDKLSLCKIATARRESPANHSPGDPALALLWDLDGDTS